MGRGKNWILGLLFSVLLVGVNACGTEVEDSAANQTVGGKADDTSEATEKTDNDQPVSFSYDSSRRVGAAEIDLAKFSQSVLRRAVAITGASLPRQGMVPAQNLLTKFARQNALTFSDEEIVNCWYTAIASVMPGFKKARYMRDDEFACLLESGFKKASQPQFGDVVRFQDKKGEEVHGATFIGYDEEGEMIVFSKNGPTKETPYGFTTIKDLTKYTYSETETVSFYRPLKAVDEPSAKSDACFAEAEKSRQETAEMGGDSGSSDRPSIPGMDGWSPM